MTRPDTTEDDKTIETWESAISGTVYVWVYDRREDRYNQQSVGGRSGSRRVHLSRDDRKYNQEQMPIENQHLDPFTNGSLRLVGSANRDELLDVRYHFTDAELGEMFEVRDAGLFIDAIKDITSELILRRLASISEERGTVAQSEALSELIRERYPIGGTQKTIREMIQEGERIGAVRAY
jgi:hypothetical protein